MVGPFEDVVVATGFQGDVGELVGRVFFIEERLDVGFYVAGVGLEDYVFLRLQEVVEFGGEESRAGLEVEDGAAFVFF